MSKIASKGLGSVAACVVRTGTMHRCPPCSDLARVALTCALAVCAIGCKLGCGADASTSVDTVKVDAEVLARVPTTLPQPGALREGWTLPSSVTVTHVDDPFEVSGESAEALAAALDAEGAKHPERDGDFAFMSWQAAWTFDYDKDPQGERPGPCGIKNVAVTLQTRAKLPHWRAPVAADPKLADAWNQYRAALEADLGGFRNNGWAAAGDIEAQLLLAPAQPNCLQMDMVANGIGNRIVEIYRGRDRAYSRGATTPQRRAPVWPPPSQP